MAWASALLIDNPDAHAMTQMELKRSTSPWELQMKRSAVCRGTVVSSSDAIDRVVSRAHLFDVHAIDGGAHGVFE